MNNTLNSKRSQAGHLEFYDTDGNLVKIEYTGGTTAFFKDGELHRDGGPAVMDPNNETWYQHGIIHRVGGPAMVYFSFGAPVQQIWIQNGVRHRTDGPAIEHFEKDHTDYDRYFINGQLFTTDEFKTWSMNKD